MGTWRAGRGPSGALAGAEVSGDSLRSAPCVCVCVCVCVCFFFFSRGGWALGGVRFSVFCLGMGKSAMAVLLYVLFVVGGEGGGGKVGGELRVPTHLMKCHFGGQVAKSGKDTSQLKLVCRSTLSFS